MTFVSSDKPIPGLKYCVRCCMPETHEGASYDELGLCLACQSSEQKMHIDWRAKELELREILNKARAEAGNNYDCILPISGGKDSIFQAHILTKIYKMRPLAVTFSHNWFSETGWYNLQNTLEQFNLDHIMYTPNRNLVNRLARRSLEVIGDSCWHCHAGVGAFSLHAAVKFRIPLLIWGESIAEGSGKGTYEKHRTFDRDYFYKVSAKATPAEMANKQIEEKELLLFEPPTQVEIDEAGVWGLHLGDYMFWDEERQTEFVRDTYGWSETEMENAYKCYKSAECIMSGMHDFTCYLKRGYGRATFQANVDVRNGLLTREEGFELIKKLDSQRPEALDYYLEITGLSEEEFFKQMAVWRKQFLGEVDLPINPKDHKNKERILPFVEYLIKKKKEQG